MLICFRSKSSSADTGRANHKGMALLVHTLLLIFDSDAGTYRQMFSVCWFPYSMVEMREFKSVAELVINELA
jgi:hypothetical protein